MALIGTRLTLSVQQTKDAGKTITGITLANPGVVTSTSHGFNNGDIVVFDITSGMSELDGQAGRVANKTTDTFEIEGLDTTNYTAFSAGTVSKISAFATLDTSQNISMPNASPAEIDLTTLLDTVQQKTFGIAGAASGTITGLYNPANTGVGLINAATKTNTPLVMKLSWSGGQFTLFNAYVSGGQGFDVQQNQAATATINITAIRDIMFYSS